MKKNQIFEFTDSNGVVVTAVVVDTLRNDENQEWLLCYTQNRLFYYWCHIQKDYETGELDYCYSYGGIAVKYCIIPELDRLLEDYQHQLDMADDYASKEC